MFPRRYGDTRPAGPQGVITIAVFPIVAKVLGRAVCRLCSEGFESYTELPVPLPYRVFVAPRTVSGPTDRQWRRPSSSVARGHAYCSRVSGQVDAAQFNCPLT